MKFIKRNAKTYIWQGYKTNEDILSELKINSVVKKIHNYRHKWVQHVRRKDRQTDRLPHLIMKYQSRGKRSQGRSLEKNFLPLNGTGAGHVV